MSICISRKPRKYRMPSNPMVESDCWALAFIFGFTTNAMPQNTILVLHKNLLLRVSFIYGITFQFTLCNHLAQNFLIFRIDTVHLQRFQPHVFFFLIRKAVPLLLRKFLITYIRYDIWISQPPGTVLIQFRKSKKVVFLDRAVHIHFFFRPAMTVNLPRLSDVVLISFKNNCGVPCSFKYQFVF